MFRKRDDKRLLAKIHEMEGERPTKMETKREENEHELERVCVFEV